MYAVVGWSVTLVDVSMVEVGAGVGGGGGDVEKNVSQTFLKHMDKTYSCKVATRFYKYLK